MRLSHLHSAGGNLPHSGLEVEFDPFSPAQFAWAHESQAEQFEGGPCLAGPFIVLDSAQQSAERFRRDDGRARCHCWRYQRAAQRGGRIVLGARGGNRVAENIAYRCSELASRFVNAARFYILEDDQDLTRRNLVDRPRSECRKRKAHEPFELSQCRRRFFIATLLVPQFARDSSERIRACHCARYLRRLLDL